MALSGRPRTAEQWQVYLAGYSADLLRVADAVRLRQLGTNGGLLDGSGSPVRATTSSPDELVAEGRRMALLGDAEGAAERFESAARERGSTSPLS